MKSKVLYIITIVALLLLTIGCGKSTSSSSSKTPSTLSRLSITPKSMMLAIGQTQQYTAVGYDQYNEILSITPEWNFTGDAGSIDSTGLFTATQSGACEIIAVAGDIQNKIDVIVSSNIPTITSVSINPESLSVTVGLTTQLSTQVFPQSIPQGVFYESANPLVATVTDTGLITAVAGGSTIITAYSQVDGITYSTCLVSVLLASNNQGGSGGGGSGGGGNAPSVLSSIAIPVTAHHILRNTQFQYTAYGYDQYGNQMGISPVWTITGGIGAITSAGLFTATEFGQGQIIATIKGLQDSVLVTVTQNLTFIDEVIVTPESHSLEVGDTVQLNTSVFPTEAPQGVVWHSANTSIATVSDTGLVTAKNTGSTSVTAYSEVNSQKLDRCQVVVVSTTPSTPQNMWASDGTYSDIIKVHWNLVDNASKYYIYRSLDSEDNFSLVGTTSQTTYNDASGTSGVNYNFKVKSWNTLGYSDFSNTDQGNRSPQGGGGGGGAGATAYVQLLLHFDGNYDDASISHHTITDTNTSISSSTKKFGSGSAIFNGVNSYLVIPYASDDFTFNTDEYTIDFWIKTSDTDGYIINTAQESNGAIGSDAVLVQLSGGKIILNEKSGGASHLISSTSLVNNNTWHHIAITRPEGEGGIIFIDGVKNSQQPLVNDLSSSARLTFAANNGIPSAQRFFDGYLDELRIINGDAYWTTNFTPSDIPWDNEYEP